MMAMSVEKNKELQIPSKLFMVKKDTVNAMPVAALIVVLFGVLLANLLTISLYFFIIMFSFFKSRKITLTRDLVITLMIMLLGVFIMAYNYNKQPLISIPMLPSDRSLLAGNMFLNSIIALTVKR